MIVVDASALIVLVKIGRLLLSRDLYSKAAIGPAVKAEVVTTGRAVDPFGAHQVEEGLDALWICEVEPTAAEQALAGELRQHKRLGPGEAEALALARHRNLAVVLDDKQARRAARAMSVRYLGTAGILLEAFRLSYLPYDELEEAMRDLGGVLWLSPAVIVEVLRRARGLKE